MRNFSKTLISMAAVMAVGSAMAAGAMAEEIVTPMSATYNVETGVVEIKNAVSNGASNTLLIVKGPANTEATEATIKQIDQVDKDEAFTEAVLGTGLVAGDEYELRVGGTNGTMQSVVFTIPKAEEEVEPEIIVVGDVNNDGYVDLGDSAYIFQYDYNWSEQQKDKTVEGYTALTADARTLAEVVEGLDGTVHYLGDVNYDGYVDLGDAAYAFQYDYNWSEQQKDKTIEGYTAFTADEIKVLPAEE